MKLRTIEDVFKRYGLEPPSIPGYCGDGWVGIVDDLLVNLLCEGWDGKVDQIKEKFGGLRLYLNNYSGLNKDSYDNMCAAIALAEDKSWKTCETCGQPGQLWRDGWWTTRCKNCHELQSQRNQH